MKRRCVRFIRGDHYEKQLKGSILLLIGTLIWGTAFVAQSVGMDYMGPFTFQATRSAIAVIALIPIIFLMDRLKPEKEGFFRQWKQPGLWKTGFFCGIALFAATGLQQMGLVYTEPGKAGFITAMYIVLVPVLGLFLGEKCPATVWVSVALAVAGLYLLSCLGVTAINVGDLLLMGCALAFAVQITLVDRMGQGLDGLRLNFIQFLVNAVISALVMFLTETPVWDHIMECAVPLLYAGILSSGVAYSLQILGQQHLEPAPASLIMSLESVFAVLAGWLLLNQVLKPTEMLGCCLVFCAVLLSQWHPKKK